MMTIRPLDLKTANMYVMQNHRHNGKVTVHRFSLGCYDDDRLCGVAIVGNPVARRLCDGLTVEVHRCCTDGTKNACSILYGRCARVAKEMGFERIITYILQSESGVTMKASGWVVEEENAGGGQKGWNVPSRPRVVESVDLFGNVTKHYPLEKKVRYVKYLKAK
jgi:hypothetical protein